MRNGESKRTKRQCQMKVNQLSRTSALNKRGQCLCCITLWITRQTGLLIHRDLQYENRIFLTCLPSYEQQTSEKIPQQDSNPLRLPGREPKRYHMTLYKTSQNVFYLTKT